MSKSGLPYTYRHLTCDSSVRLIRITQRPVSHDIVCTIHHFEDHEAPAYMALSYLWGDPAPTRVIWLGNSTDTLHIQQIHENLWQFLDVMCEQQAFDTYLWIDNLCLDQANVHEIGRQIPRMGIIYATAESTIVWLGAERALETSMGTLISIENYDAGLTAAREILDVPYWRRVWVVQEFVRAKQIRVLLGRYSIDLDDLSAHIGDYFTGGVLVPQVLPFRSMCDLRNGKVRKPSDGQFFGSGDEFRGKLWELIDFLGTRQSTKTFDKVYGLLGLVEANEDGTSPSQLIEVNYQKEAFEVFWDVALECGASWHQVESVGFLATLQKAVFAEEVPSLMVTLEWYLRASRTSSRHRELAGLALRGWRTILDLLESLPRLTIVSRWISQIRPQSTQDKSVHRRAVFLGVRCAIEYFCNRTCQGIHRSSRHYSGKSWFCAEHNDWKEDAHLSTGDGGYICFAHLSFSTSTAESVCGQSGLSSKCNDSLICSEIPGVGLRMFLVLNRTSPGAEISNLCSPPDEATATLLLGYS